MPKRFTATEKWESPWFRKLPNEYKLFWCFILDKCDISGIWYVDFDMASFLIGNEIKEEMAKNFFQKQIIILNEGNKWFIKDFINFQYGNLTPNNNLHRAVIALLEKSGAQEGLKSLSAGAKVKVKVKDKVNKGGVGGFDFEAIWALYPNKVGKQEAERHFKAKINTQQDYKDIQTALNIYLNTKRVKSGYIQNGSTWFNNWRDWINYQEPLTEKDKENEIRKSIIRAD